MVSAPSGTGKTTLVRALLALDSHLEVAVSHTTRDMREGDKEGEDYYFVDNATFEALIAADGFVEHALVFGNTYGTSKGEVERILSLGVDLLLEIDCKGARRVVEAYEDACTIFIAPPSLCEMEKRLRARGKDDEATIRTRLLGAKWELSQAPSFDYLVVNDHFEHALGALQSIITAERHRMDSSDTIRLLCHILNS